MAAAALVPELAPRIMARESRVQELLEEAWTEFLDQDLLHADQELNAVLMVGTGHSDAWVRVVDGQPVLFVALKMLKDAESDKLLVVHEFFHVVHVHALLQLLVSDPVLGHSVGMRVWLEGVAVAATRLLQPGHLDTDYLFVPNNQWIQECLDSLPAIAPILLPNLTAIDPTIAYSLCGVTDDYPWPSRAGYWVGDLVVREMLDSGHDLSDLITWGPDRVAWAFRESAVLQAYRS